MIEKELLRPRSKTENIVIQELPDELLVYDLSQNQAHCLNKMAALIWQLCDGQKSVPEITMLVREESDILIDETTIWMTLKQLQQANLLAELDSFPSEGSKLTRRNAVKKIGRGTTLALPWVTSIVAPTAILAASPGVCADECRASGLGQVGSAANCGACADVPGTCFSVINCGSGGSPYSSTCATCSFSTWKPT